MSRSSEQRMGMVGVGPRSIAQTFARGKAPTKYVAGLGRGAIGFTTRSDIGPARTPASAAQGGAPGQPFVPDFGQAPAGYVAGRGRGMGDLARLNGEGRGRGRGGGGADAVADTMDYTESNFDQFSGYEERLFGDTPYDEADQEADRVYEAVDEYMESSRKGRKTAHTLEEMKKLREDRPKISDQFADLKSKLSDMSQKDWEAIPDVGDYSLKHKQVKRKEIFTPMPDHVIESSRTDGQVGTMETSSGGALSSISGLAEARGKVLGLNLDRMSDNVSGQTVVDPKGYLTDLNSLKVNSDAEVGDIEKARLLLRSVTSTNPKHGPGWIAAARLEEYAGKLVAARKTIKQGCEICPDNEDVWLEASRLQTPDNAKSVLANAVRHLPGSVKIWLRASELEVELPKKRIVLRRALEFIPNSVKLWRTAIELEGVADARVMLARAVECVPHSVDMWLALARLETYENARRVLNEAREALPTEPAIWVTACKLEEAQGATAETLDRMVEKALASLRQYQVVSDREAWLKEAEAAESAGAPITCGAIVRATIQIGVEAEDRKRTWLDDAENCMNRGSIETARAILAYALTVFQSKKGVWMRAAALEKKHGTRQALEDLLMKAVRYCPKADLLWLMLAKERWLAGDVEAARATLQSAFKANPDKEEIWLAAIKLEWENREAQRARMLLAKARERAPTQKVWMKSALLEREEGQYKDALVLLDKALVLYPTFDKLYMMAAQICSEDLQNQRDKARTYYQQGLRNCPGSVHMWKLAAELEEIDVGANKARSMLELARLRNPKTPLLWLAAIRLERRTGESKAVENLMAKALQECPTSGLLWAEEILTAPRAQQKGKSVEALKRCDNDPHVITAVAQLFERDRKYAKARKWFTRAVTLDPDNGDAWAAYLAFELQQGTPEQATDVRTRCAAAEPSHGELWCSVSKRMENRRLSSEAILLKVVAEKFSNKDNKDSGKEASSANGGESRKRTAEEMDA